MFKHNHTNNSTAQMELSVKKEKCMEWGWGCRAPQRAVEYMKSQRWERAPHIQRTRKQQRAWTAKFGGTGESWGWKSKQGSKLDRTLEAMQQIGYFILRMTLSQ